MWKDLKEAGVAQGCFRGVDHCNCKAAVTGAAELAKTTAPCAAPVGLRRANAGVRQGPMNKADYVKYHRECCDRMHSTTLAKNSDYTGKTDDPFANFADTPRFAGVSVEQGFLVRMGDKMARIRSLIEKGSAEVKDESIQDTLLDLANYAILLSGYLKGRRDEAK